MTLNELIKRVYYFPDPYMHFKADFKYGSSKRKVLVFGLSTELTSKEKNYSKPRISIYILWS